jgi:hypothetical protein
MLFVVVFLYERQMYLINYSTLRTCSKYCLKKEEEETNHTSPS